MLTLLVLLFTNPAQAQDQGTAMTSQQEATLLLQQQEQAAAASARVAKAEAEAEKARLAYEQAQASATADRAALAALQAEAAKAKAEAEKAKLAYEQALAALPTAADDDSDDADDDGDLPEATVTGSHPIVYGGGALVIGPALEGGTGGFAPRVTLGTRFAWDLSDTSAFGLVVEGDWGSGGPGIRALPTFIGYGKTGGWGIGAGAAYNCDDLQVGAGCLTEHVGGLARLSWEKGGRVGGVIVNLDEEVNYLTLDGGIEFRTVVGLSVYLGSTRTQVVTVE